MGETSTSRFEITTPRIVALIALLVVFAEAVNNYWTGSAALPALAGVGQIAIAVLLMIIDAILMIAIIANVVDLKLEILKKLYNWIVLLIIGVLVLLLELSAVNWDGVVAWTGGSILGGLLVLIAAVLEIVASKKENLSPAKLLTLVGIICAIVDIILLIATTVNVLMPLYVLVPSVATQLAVGRAIYYIVIAIILVIILLIIVQNKIKVKFLKYQWWLILIIGFIFYNWYAGQITGIIILIAFIIMIRE